VSDPFADDVLTRLAQSNQDYQREHGHYIVPLAERLLAARSERDRYQKVLEEIAAYEDDCIHRRMARAVLAPLVRRLITEERRRRDR